MSHYIISFSFVNGLGMSETVETMDEVLEQLARYDHEGCSFTIEHVIDITDVVEELYRN